MRFLLTYLLLIIAFSSLAALAIYDATHQHECDAPCVVKFKQPMEEDNFKIDYRGDGTLKVWKKYR